MVWQEGVNNDGYIYYAGETPNPQLSPRLWKWVLRGGEWRGFSDVFNIRGIKQRGMRVKS